MNKIKSNNLLIIYHQKNDKEDCPDGICSAWIAYRNISSYNLYDSIEVTGDYYLAEQDYLKDSYQFPFDVKDKDVILVDFAYPSHILEWLSIVTNSVLVIDHHKSRMNDLKDLSKYIQLSFSLTECGATLTWNYFYPNKPQPWFLPHVKNRDIGSNGYYEGNCSESEAVTIAIQHLTKGLVGKEAFKVYEYLLSVNKEEVVTEDIYKQLEERNEILQYELDKWDGELMKVGEYVVPIYRLESLAYAHYSLVGSKAAIEHKSLYPFVAIVCDNPKIISLRAAKDSLVDLSILSKSLGGGGHPRAAGYTIN